MALRFARSSATQRVSPPARCRPKRPRFRPRLEQLESREVPAIFNVGAGDVPGLIASINAANGNGQANTITLTPGSTLTLTAPQNTLFGPAGLPAITSPLTIEGAGATIQRAPTPGTPAFRLFTVLESGSLTLDRVVLTNGLAQGGAGGRGFDEAGGGAGLGGAIFNAGSLTLVNSTLTGNLALGGEVGDRNATYGGNGGGGGLGGNGGNGATPLGGGGYGGGGGGGNQGAGANGNGVSGGVGGALTGGNGGEQNQPGADATGIGGGGGGGSQGTYAGGAGGFGGGGGGGRLTPTPGDGGFGGGAGRFGLPGFGGGGDPVARTGGGGAGLGGTVFNFAGSVTITNCTLTANTAQGGSGVTASSPVQVFVGGSGLGGAVFNLNGSVLLLNVTLANNTVQAGASNPLFLPPTADGGAIYNLAFPAEQGVPNSQPASVTLINSILSGSIGGSDLANTQAGLSGGAAIDASAPNIVQTQTNLGGSINGGGIIQATPLLGPLQNNGGPTPTMALLPGSPAIGAGTPVGAPATDQRGFPRPAGGPIDLGAFQTQPPPPPPPSSGGLLITGAGVSGLPEVKVFDGRTGQLRFDFLAFEPSFTGGVRVALADTNGDDISDIIVGRGPGGPPEVKVFDGRTLTVLFDFLAFTPTFIGGVYVAGGDLNRDGRADIVVGADAGGAPEVKAFSGAGGAVLMDFLAYSAEFTGGVRVGVGDVNGDGFTDIITGTGPGAPPEVRVFSGAGGALLQDYLAYSPAFRGGIFVAGGDVNGDGRADVITGPGLGSAPEIRVFSGAGGALLRDFLAYPVSASGLVPIFGDVAAQGGWHVGATNLNGDGKADILTGPGAGGPPEVKAFDGATLRLLDDFFAYNPAFLGGVFVGG